MWKITYASPFFGWDSLRQMIEFKGAVAVSVDSREQCYLTFFVNAETSAQ